jgi:hypothetical protein
MRSEGRLSRLRGATSGDLDEARQKAGKRLAGAGRGYE